jgi:hypothetical protein
VVNTIGMVELPRFAATMRLYQPFQHFDAPWTSSLTALVYSDSLLIQTTSTVMSRFSIKPTSRNP